MLDAEIESPLQVEGQEATLNLQGDLTVFTVDALKDDVFLALNCPRIRVSLAAVTDIDSCGLQLLLLLARQAQHLGRDFALSHRHPEADALLALYGLDLPSPAAGEGAS
ncbi:STAS domain-containing protein [uncultured Dechloromonas sp.]|uniref:STAS domain-containing protein n=1 Tax=uncultured Dechloromonas sp. TaxID=171719 RepID=UPI0025F850EC|nr:STAS domain-containing protein [uncultured Dechloromonas sp.]